MNENSLSKIIDVELRRVLVKVLLVPHEVLALVEVQCVVLVAVGGPGVPQGGSSVVERLGEVDAVVLVPCVICAPLQDNSSMNTRDSKGGKIKNIKCTIKLALKSA